jgi:hypothetical protein
MSQVQQSAKQQEARAKKLVHKLLGNAKRPHVVSDLRAV